MSRNRFSAHRQEGRCSSFGKMEQPTDTETVSVVVPEISSFIALLVTADNTLQIPIAVRPRPEPLDYPRHRAPPASPRARSRYELTFSLHADLALQDTELMAQRKHLRAELGVGAGADED